MKVIDLELDLPPDAEQLVSRLKDYLFHSTEKGMANYGNVFGVQRARALDFTPEEIKNLKNEKSPAQIERVLKQRARKALMTLPRFVEQMDEAGIEWGAVFAGDSDKTAAVVAQFPDRFIGTANINPLEGMKAVRELEEGGQRAGDQMFLRQSFPIRDPGQRSSILSALCQGR